MRQFSLDISNVPKELHFILDLLKHDTITKINLNSYRDIDWNAFIELSFHHRVYPILFSKLKQFNGEIIPLQVMESISFHYKKNTFQMLQLSAVTENMSRLFSEKNIPLILLKGPALGRSEEHTSELQSRGHLVC